MTAGVHVDGLPERVGLSPLVFLQLGDRVRPRLCLLREQGVDIALTKNMLKNAFLNNWDVAVTMTGDADYRPVIDELKRLARQSALWRSPSVRRSIVNRS